MLIIKCLLMFIYIIMHFPKPILYCRLQLAAMLCMWMTFSEWKIPKNKAQIITKLLLNFFDYWVGLSTIGTFITAIFYQCHRSRSTSLNMIGPLLTGKISFTISVFMPNFSYLLLF